MNNVENSTRTGKKHKISTRLERTIVRGDYKNGYVTAKQLSTDI